MWKTSIFRRVADCKKFFKGFPALSKIPNSLKQVLQTYSEICNFLCATKKVLQKQSAKIDFKVPGKSCDEIDDDMIEIHDLANSGQKYECNLRY